MVAQPRDRFRAAGGKSDRFDAFVLCEPARTDSHRFAALTPDSDQTKALRALTRGREVLVEQRVCLCNQLRAELERFWPGATEIFADLDSPISLAFLERYPSPTAGKTTPPTTPTQHTGLQQHLEFPRFRGHAGFVVVSC